MPLDTVLCRKKISEDVFNKSSLILSPIMYSTLLNAVFESNFRIVCISHFKIVNINRI